VIYAGSCFDPALPVVVRSADAGASWEDRSAGLDAECLNALAVDPADPDLAYAASGGRGVFATGDRGASWYPLNAQLDAAGVIAYALAMSQDGTVLIAGGAGGIRQYGFSSDLWTDLTAAPASVTAGDGVTYTATFANDGPDDATGVVGSLNLPAGVSIAPGQVTTHCASSDGHAVTCDLGTVPAGEGLTLTVKAPAPEEPGIARATTTITGQRPDSYKGDNAASASFSVAARVATQTPDTLPPASLILAGKPGAIDPLSRRFQRARSFTLAWSASDPSGIGSYDIRVRTATIHASFGTYRGWRTATENTGASYRGTPGTTVCFSLRARDQLGNTSGWSSDRCTAIPFGAGGISRHVGWARVPGGAFGPALAARKRGSQLILPGVRARRVALIATRCPGCGEVSVAIGGKRIGTINLAGGRARETALFQLAPLAALRHGTLRLTVSSHGRPVRIEAVGVSAT
jgi:uncharacterized repeat protein (TIGR01451 family)